MKKSIIFITAVIFALGGCEDDLIITPFTEIRTTPKDSIAINPSPNDQYKPDLTYGMVTDIDGNVYKTIQIGYLTWTVENLKTTRYNDGTPIPNIVSGSEWKLTKEGACCHYDNDPSNSEKFGLLYNHYAVATNKLAPEGWHVATTEDWENLVVSSNSGSLVDSVNWGVSSFSDMNYFMSVCDNSSGFTALPNGYRDFHWDCWIRNVNGPVVFELQGDQACWLASNGVYYLDQTFGLWEGASNDLTVIGGGVRLVKN